MIEVNLSYLTSPHGYRDSCLWCLTRDGISVDGQPPETWGGEPSTVRRIWQDYRQPLEYYADAYGVPVELVIATAATETGGNPSAVRLEPRYVSDEKTPNKMSCGMMQTLLSTAREVLENPIDRAFLLRPAGSIQAGTVYIRRQKSISGFDPVFVAAAYNSGGLYYQASPQNRWRLRQYPIGTGEHCDRFAKWFNEIFGMFAMDSGAPEASFHRILRSV